MKFNKELFKGSIILLVAFGLFNIFNFLTQFFMARMLSISDFGIFATLSSMTYLLSILIESSQTVVAKYSSNSSEKGKLKDLLLRSLNNSLNLSFIIFSIYLFISLFLKDILNISYTLLIINGSLIFTSLSLPITRGLMQGKKKFLSLGTNMVIESFFRLISSLLLVYIGWKVYGAVIGVIIGALLAFLFSLQTIKQIILSKRLSCDIKDAGEYIKPTLLINFSIVLFYSMDIIIARMLFSSELAGAYSIASIISKSIFWGTLPISKVMFSLSSQEVKHTRKNILNNSFFILISLLSLILLIFYFLPDFLILIFSGRKISEAASVLFFLGLAMSLLSISNLIILNKLSSDKISINKSSLFIMFIIVEAILLTLFSDNLFEFSLALVTASSFYLWGSVKLLEN